jgi:hypothetical protein
MHMQLSGMLDSFESFTRMYGTMFVNIYGGSKCTSCCFRLRSTSGRPASAGLLSGLEACQVIRLPLWEILLLAGKTPSLDLTGNLAEKFLGRRYEPPFCSDSAHRTLLSEALYQSNFEREDMRYSQDALIVMLKFWD